MDYVYKMNKTGFEKVLHQWTNYCGNHGQGEYFIPLTIIEKVEEILKGIHILVETFPTPRNTIQVEYESEEDNVYMEAEVFKDKIRVFKCVLNPRSTLLKNDNMTVGEVISEFNRIQFH